MIFCFVLLLFGTILELPSHQIYYHEWYLESFCLVGRLICNIILTRELNANDRI